MTDNPTPDMLPCEWREGAPEKPWSEKWFIAITTFGDRVVLRALPEEYTYDFKTADDTYIKRERIAKWMQFPDNEFIAPATRPIEAEEASSRVLTSEQGEGPTADAYMRTCRALNWRNAQLHANGIEPVALDNDSPHYPPADYDFASPTPVTPDEGLAGLCEALACDCDAGEDNDWEDHEWRDAADLLRRAAAALRRPTEAADQTRALLSELRELLRQTTNVLALSDKNDPTECIAGNGMTVWDGIRSEYERLWPQTTAALSRIDAHLQGPDTDGGQS